MSWSRRTKALVAAGAVLAVVGAGEGTARLLLEHRITNGVSARLAGRVTGQVDVGLGPAPALIDLARRSVPQLSVAATGVQACAIAGLTVDAELTDVHWIDDTVEVSRSAATVIVPTAALQTTAAQRLGHLGGLLAITPDPDAGVLRVSVGGFASFTEIPSLDKSQLTLTPADVTLAGQPATAQISDALLSRATLHQDLPKLPLGMTAQEVAVTTDGLSLTLAGDSGTMTGRSDGGAYSAAAPGGEATGGC